MIVTTFVCSYSFTEDLLNADLELGSATIVEHSVSYSSLSVLCHSVMFNSLGPHELYSSPGSSVFILPLLGKPFCPAALSTDLILRG